MKPRRESRITRLLLGLCTGVLLFAASPGALWAAPFSYAVNTDDDLFSVDVSTGTKTLVGNTGVVFLQGLALSPGGVLFGTDSDGNLYRINTTTAAATLVGNTGLGNIEGLDFKGTTLLATDFNTTPTVYSLDTSTAAPTSVVTANTATGLLRTMAVLDANTILARGDGPPNNTLYSINLSTGAVTTIGTLGVFGDQFAAMDFLSDGLLYGLDTEGSVWRIDPATAGVTLLGNTGDDFWLDMTEGPGGTPVAEPTTLVLLGTALAGLGWRLRHRLR